MEMELPPDNMNKEKVFSFIKLWKSLFQTLQEQRKTFFKERDSPHLGSAVPETTLFRVTHYTIPGRATFTCFLSPFSGTSTGRLHHPSSYWLTCVLTPLSPCSSI
jgi:hypothetical protein